MGRSCAECDRFMSNSSFSANQWRKGEGYSRCLDCINDNSNRSHSAGASTAYYEKYECSECSRQFNSENELNMHKQVHRPRNVACPICGDARFRSGANAVQHIESGFCRGCEGQDNARKQIYNFVSNQPQMHRYLSNVPMLGYDDRYQHNDEMPEKPYKCNFCDKCFKHLSQQMQHQDQKHNVRYNVPRIGH